MDLVIGYYAGESDAIADLFTRSVHELAAAHYTAAEREAWAPRPVDLERWRWRCELERPFVCRIDGAIAGFLELDPDGHVDCHYVHPAHARRGVARALLRHAIDVARGAGLARMCVEASHGIRPLYERHGFACLGANRVERRGVVLQNWRMERTLAAAADPAP